MFIFVAAQEPSHRDSNPALIEEDMAVMSDFELHHLCQQYPTLHDHQLTTEQLLDSGKLHLLTPLLTDLKEQVGASSLVVIIVYKLTQSHSTVRFKSALPFRVTEWPSSASSPWCWTSWRCCSNTTSTGTSEWTAPHQWVTGEFLHETSCFFS